jgi:hypothetical protein
MLVRLRRIVPVFAMLGLVGPAFRMAVPTWQSVIGTFAHDLTWFLWPTQAIAVVEVNVGRLKAFLAAAGANVVLFLILGLVLAIVGGSRTGIWAFRVFVVGLLAYWAALGAGYDPAFVSYGALSVAVAAYMAPLWLFQTKGWLGDPRPREAA